MRHTTGTKQQSSEVGPNATKELLARMLILKIGLLMFFAAVALRLVHVQVVDAAKYQGIAKRQYESKVVLPAERGNIYDRNGKILASNSLYVSFAADPDAVGNNASEVSERFARAMGEPK